TLLIAFPVGDEELGEAADSGKTCSSLGTLGRLRASLVTELAQLAKPSRDGQPPHGDAPSNTDQRLMPQLTTPAEQLDRMRNAGADVHTGTIPRRGEKNPYTQRQPGMTPGGRFRVCVGGRVGHGTAVIEQKGVGDHSDPGRV